MKSQLSHSPVPRKQSFLTLVSALKPSSFRDSFGCSWFWRFAIFILASAFSFVPSRPASASSHTEGAKKVLIIRVDFSDKPGEPLQGTQPFTTEVAQDLLDNRLNNFYKATSDNKTSISGDVTPVVRMPQTHAWYNTLNADGSDRISQLAVDARAAAKAAGYDSANYNFDLFAFSRLSRFSWAGLGMVGGKGSWLNGDFSGWVSSHELGHNYGLWHSNLWETSDGSIIGPGTSITYGHVFDRMGSGPFPQGYFGVSGKNRLDWLPDSDVLTVASSGTYRIMAHDMGSPSGRRGLMIPSDGLKPYWVEFRQLQSGNRWAMNGAIIYWGDVNGSDVNLLDMTPQSPDGANDAPLLLGRTFSDNDAGVHITPINKVGTSPESLDVVVNLGKFPNNHPPTATISASTTNPSVNTSISLSVAGSDPDGDPLSVAWDFGDKTYASAIANSSYPAYSSTTGKSWSSTSYYVVRCTVSDRKGGTASDSIVIRIGSASGYSISGRVTSAGQPLVDAIVKATSTRLALTDSDGTYTIAPLPAGSYTLTAFKGNYALSPANFTNPVTVGTANPNQTNVNFTGTNTLVTTRIVTNTNDSGPGSLRQALTDANNYPGTTIKFNIPVPTGTDPNINYSNGVWTIKPLSLFPAIRGRDTVIDGTSQTAFAGNRNPDGPEIVINGSDSSGADGIGLFNSGAIIKGLVINGFAGSSVLLYGAGAKSNTLQGCYIGTDATGSTAVTNGSDSIGVYIKAGAKENTVGGPGDAARNIISGNYYGIFIDSEDTSSNVVQNNYIGLNASGTSAIPNTYGGIILYGAAHHNQIGGTTPALRNVISGNKYYGIYLSGVGTDSNLIRGNDIGLNSAGSAGIPNGLFGVIVENGPLDNIIGGLESGAANRIAFNTVDGIALGGTSSTTVRGNSIYANTRLGINLAGGTQNNAVTANDTGDSDTGPNGLQNYPVLTQVTSLNSNTLIGGTLNSNPNATFAIDFYRNSTNEANGYGEGEFYLGSCDVTTDANGNATFSYQAAGVFTGQYYSATATKITSSANIGDTSEFSQSRRVESAALSLTITPMTFSENAGAQAALATVSRNTPTTDALVVELSSSNMGAATVPATLTIPAGQISAQFPVSAVNDSLNDGAQTSLIRAASNGFTAASMSVTVADDDAPGLALTVSPLDVNEGDGLRAATGTISRNTSTAHSLTVTLNNSDSSEINIPAQVTIPAGQTGVTFDVDAVDDNIVDGSQSAVINMSAAGYSVNSVTVTVADNDAPMLSLTIQPLTFSEAAGVQAAVATVTRNTSTLAALDVTLSSSDTSAAKVPAGISIQPGQSMAQFLVSAVDDALIDGPQTSIVTATAVGFTTATADLTVTDNDLPSLTVTVEPAIFNESAGAQAALGTVRRTGPRSNPLTVNLASNNVKGAKVPANVVIPANAGTATFAVAAVNDTVPYGEQQVVISANAAGYTPGSATVQIVDDDTATLGLTFAPAIVQETAGTTTATLTRNSPTTKAVAVTLSSTSDAAIVPGLVSIPAGRSFTTFAVKVKDDEVAQGDRQVDIYATAVGHTAAITALKVQDNETPSLHLQISSVIFSESADEAATLTVTRNTPTDSALRVTLTSSDTSAVRLPAMVTIPTNAVSGSCFVSAVDDDLADGMQSATITASAAGMAPAQVSVRVTNDDATPAPTPTPTVAPTPTTAPLPTPTAPPDILAPSVAFSSPLNGSRSPLFPAITGIARDRAAINGALTTGVQSVILTLRRALDGRYWDGGAWVTTPTNLDAELGGTPLVRTFRYSGNIPAGANLLTGVYYLSTVAFDGSRNRGQQTVSFSVLDLTAPIITIATPTNGATLNRLSQLNGTLTEEATGTGPATVILIIRRSSDGFYWNGVRWVPGQSALRTTLRGSGNHLVWTADATLPAAPSTGRDVYFISAFGYDRSWNRGVVNIAVTMDGSAAVRTAAVPASRVALSTATAAAATQSIDLIFDGALHVASIDTVAFAVSREGIPATVKGVTYDASSSGITVFLAEDSIKAGERLSVSWNGLLDLQGRKLEGQTQVTAR